jgi:hypothetical protein
MFAVTHVHCIHIYTHICIHTYTHIGTHRYDNIRKRFLELQTACATLRPEEYKTEMALLWPAHLASRMEAHRRHGQIRQSAENIRNVVTRLNGTRAQEQQTKKVPRASVPPSPTLVFPFSFLNCCCCCVFSPFRPFITFALSHDLCVVPFSPLSPPWQVWLTWINWSRAVSSMCLIYRP